MTPPATRVRCATSALNVRLMEVTIARRPGARRSRERWPQLRHAQSTVTLRRSVQRCENDRVAGQEFTSEVGAMIPSQFAIRAWGATAGEPLT